MNEKIARLITPENVLSYTKACVKVCEVLMDLKAENYRRLVIPSRGAYPFYRLAIKTSFLLSDTKLDAIENTSHFKVLLLPYTADWGGAGVNINANSVRKFWSKILADSIRKKTTPYTLFYNNLVDLIGTRLTINATDLKIDKYKTKIKSDDEKFIFIDTAISGRAICDIIESFYEFNLKDFYIIMITDASGSKIKPRYKSIIEREKQRQKLVQINVENIYSEDASPLLNGGISSLVFPSLLERALNEIPEFKKNQFAGAGLWFVDSASHLRKLSPKLNGVIGGLAALHFMGLQINLGDKFEHFNGLVGTEVEDMSRNLANFNLFDSLSTKTLIYDRIKSRTQHLKEIVDVTSSHVIRIYLEPDITSRLIKPLQFS